MPDTFNDKTRNIASTTTTPPQGSQSAGASNALGGRPALPVWIYLGGGLLLLGHVPVLLAFFANLWGKPHYQFFPLAMLASAFLGYTALKRMPNPFEASNSWASGCLLGVALALLGLNIVMWSPWLGAIATLFSLLGCILWLGGWPLLWALFPAILMLLTMIPPPLSYDMRLTLGLQRLGVRWSSTFMDLLNIPHTILGNTIEIPGHRLLVDEACSGINSVLSVSAFALFFGMWRKRAVWKIIIAMVTGLAFVLMGNLVRIMSGAYLKYFENIDILSSWKHDLSGLILFAIYLGLVVSFYRLLDFFGWFVNQWWKRRRRSLGVSDDSDEVEDASPSISAPSVGHRVFSPVVVFGAAILFAAVGVIHGYQTWTQRARLMQMAKIDILPAALKGGGQFDLPVDVGPWHRIEMKEKKAQRLETIAQYSHYWAYQNGPMVVYVALDFPYQEAHDLTVCYVNSGWIVSDRKRLATPPQKMTGQTQQVEAEQPFMQLRMEKPPLVFGSLWFSHLNTVGQWVDLPDRFAKPDPHPTFQVQLLAYNYSAIDDSQMQALTDLFLQVRQTLGQQIMAKLNGSNKP